MVKFQSLTIYESRTALYVVAVSPLTYLNIVVEIARPLQIKDDEKVSLKVVTEQFNGSQLAESMSPHKATSIHSNVSCLFGFVRLSASFYLIIASKSVK